MNTTDALKQKHDALVAGLHLLNTLTNTPEKTFLAVCAQISDAIAATPALEEKEPASEVAHETQKCCLAALVRGRIEMLADEDFMSKEIREVWLIEARAIEQVIRGYPLAQSVSTAPESDRASGNPKSEFLFLKPALDALREVKRQMNLREIHDIPSVTAALSHYDNLEESKTVHGLHGTEYSL